MTLYLKVGDDYKSISKLVRLLTSAAEESLDIIERCRSIKSEWYKIGLDNDQEDFVRIVSIDSQTDHLPKGSAREHWNENALKKMDKESRDCERDFKDVFERSCNGMMFYLCEVDEWEVG